MDKSSDHLRRILIVDDNRDIHGDFRKILMPSAVADELAEAEVSFFGEAKRATPASYEYEIDSAFQGQEGLELAKRSLAREQPYDLAFVDMRMPPGWDGLQTIEQLWKQDSDLPIVICTAYSDYCWSDMIGRLGQSDKLLILKKPFDNSEVAQLAAALTNKRWLAQQAALRMEQLETLVEDRTRDLQQVHQASERLLAAISSLLVEVDAQGVVHRWNDSAQRIFGLPAAEAVGKRFLELEIEWDDRQRVSGLLNLKPGSAERRLEIGFRNREGRSRVLGLSVYPVADHGITCGLLILGIDMSDHRVLQQQLQQAQKLEAVGQLAAGVAHEINTPMQYVGDNLEFVQKKIKKLAPLLERFGKYLASDEHARQDNQLLADMSEDFKRLKVDAFLAQVTEALDDSREGVQHVSRIVRAMKEFAHPGQEEKTPVDINRALESTVAVSTNEWKYVATVEMDFEKSIPLVPALAGELNQVFLNILVNAAHAIGDVNDGGAAGKGTITLSTRSAGGFVEVSIADSGTGIPDETKQRIFDPFFTTKEIGKGTGQGLAIAHSVVVQKHGGMLRCDSSPGVGTTFVIQLPLDPREKETHNELQSAIACE